MTTKRTGRNYPPPKKADQAVYDWLLSHLPPLLQAHDTIKSNLNPSTKAMFKPLLKYYQHAIATMQRLLYLADPNKPLRNHDNDKGEAELWLFPKTGHSIDGKDANGRGDGCD